MPSPVTRPLCQDSSGRFPVAYVSDMDSPRFRLRFQHFRILGFQRLPWIARRIVDTGGPSAPPTPPPPGP